MPELPEVETVARIVRPVVTGSRIEVARAVPHEKWASATTARGAEISAVRRRGKHLLVDLDDGHTLAIHLGMTGVVRLESLSRGGRIPPSVRHERVLLALRNRDGDRALVRLVDPRGFGHAIVAARDADGTVALAALLAMGPEPLDDWTARQFIDACSRRSTAIKAVLLDQSVVAGIGNYLADEMLFAAGINPAATADSLSAARLRRLHEHAQRVILAAVEAGGATISDYRHPDGSSGDAQFHLRAYGREGEPCTVCGSRMRKSVVAGRGTTFCGRCQRR